MAELLDAVSDEIALADSPTPPRQLLDYGTIDFKLHNTGSAAEFIKVTPRIDQQEIVEIALNSWELEPEPTMLLRICGSDTDRMVEAKEVIEGAIMAASATNAWIFCAGLDFGLPSIVGQVLQQRRHACEAPLIGVVSFASIQKREQLNLNAKGTDVATQGSKRSYTDGEPDPDMSTVSLQPNHTHFVICDQGEGAEVKASRSNVERAQALLDARKRSFTFAHEIERAVSEYEGRCVPPRALSRLWRRDDADGSSDVHAHCAPGHLLCRCRSSRGRDRRPGSSVEPIRKGRRRPSYVENWRHCRTICRAEASERGDCFAPRR